MKNSYVVSKFGGTSMASISAMEKCASIVIEKKSSLVVVSATAGTTDQLIQIAKDASSGKVTESQILTKAIKERHQSMLSELSVNTPSQKELIDYFNELDVLVQNMILLKELTPKAYDQFLSLGERISSLIFKEVLQKNLPHITVHLVDARKLIKTDSHFGMANPLIETLFHECSQLNKDLLYVTQGFIGSDMQGNTTTLGRGGSDYSAALLAEALNASVLEIWTDVAGIATTDPRLYPQAKIISELSYEEASEMAQFGAKILHPATIIPAIRKSIPVFVGSTFEKDQPGTWIRQNVDARPAVRAIAKRSRQALVTLSNPKMHQTHGLIEDIFSIFSKNKIHVDCITTSEISMAITVDHHTLENKVFIQELETFGKIHIEDGHALISLIGNDLLHRLNLIQSVLTSVDKASIRMMSLGASSSNLNFLIKEENSLACIESLHKSLIEESL